MLFSGLLGYAWMKEHSIDKEVALMKKTVPEVMIQVIMETLKKECLGANIFSLEFMGEDKFSLVCKMDKKSKRRKK